jgi:hypothetical protein
MPAYMGGGPARRNKTAQNNPQRLLAFGACRRKATAWRLTGD